MSTNPRANDFPAFFFHATKPMTKVKDMAGYLALGPGWYDTPDQTKWGKQATPLAVVEADAPAEAEVMASLDPEVVIEPYVPSEEDLADAAKVHAVPVAELVKVIGGIDIREALVRMRLLETLHPRFKGGRPNALRAIDQRLKIVT